MTFVEFIVDIVICPSVCIRYVIAFIVSQANLSLFNNGVLSPTPFQHSKFSCFSCFLSYFFLNLFLV